MRLPDPIANTTTEAYLAYKAGVLAKGDLKPKLYEPYIHLDAWLAYWTGLTKSYPVKNVGKNLFDKNTDVLNGNYYLPGNIASTRIVTAISSTMARTLLIRLQEGQTYTIQKKVSARFRFGFTTTNNPAPDTDGVITSRLAGPDTSASVTFTVPKGSPYFVCNFFSDDQAADAQNGYDTIVNSIQIEEGSTATSYEPYTGEPEILTDEEAYVAYLSGVTDTYPQEFRDPADIRVAAYLRYLISARWGRPEYPVTNEELYLSMLKTKYIPSGDPSSDIVIDGTTKAPFQDVKMYGDTFQQSYEGKNRIGFPDQAERTINGLTYSVKDGIVTVNGTATATTFTDSSTLFNFKEAGDITLSIEILGGTQSNSVIGFQNRNSQTGQLRWQQVRPSIETKNTKAIDAQTVSDTADIRLFMNLGSVFNNFKFRLMAEYGSAATTYEPFVGGVPSPNPEYPQPIQKVTGLQTVEVVGKNLNRFPYASGSSRTHRGVTFTANPDGSVTIKGTHDGSGTAIYYLRDFWAYNEADGVIVDANTTITASITGGTGIRFIAEGYHSDGTYDQLNTTSTQTITTTAKATFNGRITVYAGFSSEEGVTVYPMLEKGSTATAYEPYSSNDYEINLGKNLFDKSSGNILAGYIPGSTIVTQEINRVVWIKCEPNTTYTISTRAESWSREVFTTKIVPAVGVAVTKLGQIGSGENSFTVQTGATAQFLAIRIWQQYLSGISLEAELGYLQIELGSQATTYAPYFTPIELCKLGTYQDYIWKDGEDWKVHKATATITLDGTEDWVYAGNYNYARCPSYTFVDIPLDDTGAQLSNYFEAIADWGTFRDSTGQNAFFPLLDEGYKISIRNTGCSSVENYKSWFAANKPSFYYPVATPTDTVITDQTLIAQLEALVAGGAENGTTYIKVSASDPNLPGLLYVEAPKYE